MSQTLSLYDVGYEDGCAIFTLNGQRGQYHYVITGQKEPDESPGFIKMLVARSGARWTDWKTIKFTCPRFEGLFDEIITLTSDINDDTTLLDRADAEHKERQERHA